MITRSDAGRRLKEGEDQVEKPEMFLNKRAVLATIPHRPPFLFIEEVTIMEGQTVAVGRMLLTGEEDFFRGHFPGRPIMPGVLIGEAICQTGACLVRLRPELVLRGKLPLVLECHLRCRATVIPPCLLVTEFELLWLRRGMGRAKGKAEVNGRVVATVASIAFAITDADRPAIPQMAEALAVQS